MRATRIGRRGLWSALLAGTLLVGPVALDAMAQSGAAAQNTRTAAKHATASRHLLTPTCSTANVAMIKRTLGITVAAARRSTAGKTFLCEYASSVSSLAVVIQYNLAAGNGNYKLVRSGFDQNNEPTTSVKSFGKLANEAFSASLGQGALAQHSVVALQGKLEVVVASSAPVKNLLILMREILTIS